MRPKHTCWVVELDDNKGCSDALWDKMDTANILFQIVKGGVKKADSLAQKLADEYGVKFVVYNRRQRKRGGYMKGCHVRVAEPTP